MRSCVHDAVFGKRPNPTSSTVIVLAVAAVARVDGGGSGIHAVRQPLVEARALQRVPLVVGSGTMARIILTTSSFRTRPERFHAQRPVSLYVSGGQVKF